MSDSLGAQTRYRVINRSLIDFKYRTLAQLKDACERATDRKDFAERTIEEDIKQMRKNRQLGFYAPIKFDKFHQAYTYSDPDYSIDKLHLNSKEIDALNFASTLMSKMNNTGLFNKFYDAVQKIFDVVNVQKAYYDGPEFDFIDFEKLPSVKGTEFIQPIIDYIQMKTVIDINYKSFYREEAKVHTLHPYLLKEYRNRWYVIGHNDDIKKIMTLGLDRIISVKSTDNKFIERDFNVQEYFKNTIGIITPKGKPPEIRIAVKKPQSDYLITQPWHHSQKHKDLGDDEVEFSFKVHPTYEFRALVLGLGSQCKVIEPSTFKNEIKQEFESAIDTYTRATK